MQWTDIDQISIGQLKQKDYSTLWMVREKQ